MHSRTISATPIITNDHHDDIDNNNDMTHTNRMKPAGGLSLCRLPGLVVHLPSGRVPVLVLGGGKRLAARLADEPGWPREAKPLSLPLLHLQKGRRRPNTIFGTRKNGVQVVGEDGYRLPCIIHATTVLRHTRTRATKRRDGTQHRKQRVVAYSQWTPPLADWLGKRF